MFTVDFLKLGEFVLVSECQKCFVVDLSSATIAICKAVRVFHDFCLLALAQLHSLLLASTQTQTCLPGLPLLPRVLWTWMLVLLQLWTMQEEGMPLLHIKSPSSLLILLSWKAIA